LARSKLKIGTRGSLLALRQSQSVQKALESFWPDLEVELRIIKTTGDRILDVPLAKVGGKGLFVKEIEDALLAGQVDLAVHSIKDVPSILPDGLEIGAVPQREDPRDVMVIRVGETFDDLPLGARVGTSSLRRAAQLRRERPDLEVLNLRGNLDTRLRKLQEGRYEAVVLAAAGLHRLGWEDRITLYLDPSRFIPAVGQGAVGIEVRKGDSHVAERIRAIHHEVTACAVRAERSFLRELEGGCQVPIGGHARMENGMIRLSGLVASLDGLEVHSMTAEAPVEDAEPLGRRVARRLLDAGGRDILEKIYAKSTAG